MELKGKRIAILAENLYEDQELWYPYYRLKEAGAMVSVVGLTGDEVYLSKSGYPVNADIAANDVAVDDFDAVIIPGGYAPDLMRCHLPMLNLVKRTFEQGRVIAMICHAGWVPISAGIIKGMKVTSTPSIKDDLVNAGAQWFDLDVVIDKNLISSRGPDDLPAFCRAIITMMAQEDLQQT